MKKRLRGLSYAKRVTDITRTFERHVRSGLSNREIWRRYIWPVYGISERTLYNMLGAPAQKTVGVVDGQGFLFPELLEEPDADATGTVARFKKEGGH